MAIATWLAASPWLLGFEHVATSLWMTIACAVLLFVPAAWMACLEETPQRIEVRSRGSQWRRPF
ncbi:SPW repeat protein [Rhizobium vallis]|uniref:SPW repeat protein n=1 Tax=Rhizobium vallis TaxID=634290 RepID=UPI001FE07FFD|nr:SPW repeat protein [Rhizobium vallis]